MATNKAAASGAGDGIPMISPDGRAYVAESEAEAMQLMVRGYRRTDGGEQAPAVEPAPSKPAPDKSTPGSST